MEWYGTVLNATTSETLYYYKDIFMIGCNSGINPPQMPTVLPTIKHRTKLFNCNCFDLFRRIPDQSIDLVLTDPPYGTTACKCDLMSRYPVTSKLEK